MTDILNRRGAWGRFVKWLDQQPPHRKFKRQHGTLCPVGCYLRETVGPTMSIDAAYYGPEDTAQFLSPQAFGDFIMEIDAGDAHAITAGSALKIAEEIK